MRKLLMSVATLAVLATPVLAQDEVRRYGKASVTQQAQDRAQQPPAGQPDRGGNRGMAQTNGAPPGATVTPQDRGNARGDRGGAQAPAQAPVAAAPQAAPQDRGNRGNWQDQRGNGRGDNGTNRSGYGRDNNYGNRNGNYDNRNGRGGYAGNGGQRNDFRNFRDFHRSYNATRRFRAPSYRRPSGWYDHRWSFGEFLPSTFWARDYWLSDYSRYDLPPPPYGALWVRVGSDALLIDEDSGEVITVEYGVFY